MTRSSLLLTAALASCGPSGPTMRIGVVLPITGALSDEGVAQLQAIQLAIDQINGAGGALGKRLEMLIRNDANSADSARAGAQALRDSGVPAIVGTVSSQLTQTLIQTASSGSVVLSASASSTVLTTPDNAGFFMRTCASDAGEGRLLAQRAHAKFTDVALLHRQGATERGLVDAFQAVFVVGGGTVTADLDYSPNQSSYGDLLQQLFASHPQAVLLDADPIDGAQIIRDYNSRFSSQGVFWFFTHVEEDVAFVVSVGAGNFTFGHLGSGPGTPTGRRYDVFTTLYRGRYNMEPPIGAYTPNAFDAVYLLALGLEQAKAADATQLKSAIRSVSLGGVAYGSDQYQDAVRAIRSGADINYEGASGSVDLDSNGDTDAPFDLWLVRDGAVSISERAVTPPL